MLQRCSTSDTATPHTCQQANQLTSASTASCDLETATYCNADGTSSSTKALLLQLAAFPKKALPRALQGLLMITASSEVGSVDSMDCSIQDNVSMCSGHSAKILSDTETPPARPDDEVQRSVSIQRMLARIAQGPPPYNPPSSKAIAAPAHRELPKEPPATACSLLDADLCAWQANSCFAESSVAQIAERECDRVSDDSFDSRSTLREPPNGFSTAACSLLDADLAQAHPCGDVHLKRGAGCEPSLASETAPFEGTSCNSWSEHAATIQCAQSYVAQTAVQDSEEVSDDTSDDHSTQREPPNEFSTAVCSLLDADLVQAHACGDTSLKRGEGCELCPASEATLFQGTTCNSWRGHFAALRSSQMYVAQTAVRDGHELSIFANAQSIFANAQSILANAQSVIANAQSDDSSDGDSVMNELVTGLAHVLGKSPQDDSHEVATQVSEGHLVTLLQDLHDDPHDDSVMNGLVTDVEHVLGKPPQDNSHEVVTQMSEGHLVTLLQNLQDDPYNAALCKNKEAHNDANQISEGYLVSLLHHILTE